MLDPLHAPDPSEETGPGSHFVPPPSSAVSDRTATPSRSQSAKLTKNPYRRLSKASKNPFVNTSELASVSNERGAESYPSPPHSASPRQSQFFKSHRSDPFGDGVSSKDGGVRVSSSEKSDFGRRRSSSLRDRYPNDPSVQPLKQIKQSHRKANHASHLKKHHQIKPDTIDQLDNVGKSYHHEGPFDATYRARNTSYKNSPVEALASSNEETLKATPRANVLDSINSHRPLDGVATIPNGMPDRDGRVYRYEEGDNMMIDGNPPGGPYKRWPGVQYLPEDVKGKGEPSYSVEKALKDHKRHEKERYKTGGGFELTSRPRSAGSDARFGYRAEDNGGFPVSTLGRSNTTGNKKHGDTGNLKKRLGGLKKKVVGSEY